MASDLPASRRWVVLVVLCVSVLAIAIDSTVLYLATSSIAADLHPSSVQLLWIVDAYSLVAAPLLLTFGTLADRYGRRRVLLAGQVVFGLGSLAAAFAPSVPVLIASRVLLGVGGAMIMPATLSLVRSVFPNRRERAFAIGIWSAVTDIGAVAGPVLGGLVIEHFWWGSIFLIGCPVMAVSILLTRWLVPESRNPVPRRWDWASAVLVGVGVLGLAFGIKQFARGDDLLLLGSLPLAVGLALLCWFTLRQRRLSAPLLDLRLFADRTFRVAAISVFVCMVALVGLELFFIQYFRVVLGIDPLGTGLRTLPLTVAAIVAGGSVGGLINRVGPRPVMTVGFLLTAASLIPLVSLDTQDHPWLVGGCFVGIGASIAATLIAASDALMSSAPERLAGAAAAVEETGYELGAGLGVALLGTIMSLRYTAAFDGAAGVSEQVRRRAEASISDAMHVAGSLPDATGDAVRHAARVAYLDALHLTVTISAATLVAVAILVFLTMPRSARRSADPAEDQARVPAHTDS